MAPLRTPPIPQILDNRLVSRPIRCWIFLFAGLAAWLIPLAGHTQTNPAEADKKEDTFLSANMRSAMLQPPQGKLWCLLIGVGGSEKTQFGRSTALQDVQRIADTFKSQNKTSAFSVSVQALVDRAASTQAIQSSLADIAAQSKPGDGILIYYMGVAFSEPRAASGAAWRLATGETLAAQANPVGTGFSVHEFGDWLAEIHDRRIAVIADLLVFPSKGNDVQSALSELAATLDKASKGIASSAPSAPPRATSRPRHGGYACFFIGSKDEALLETSMATVGLSALGFTRGLAEDLADELPSGNTDGLITLAEVLRYLEKTISEVHPAANPPQEPLHWLDDAPGETWTIASRPQRMAELAEWRKIVGMKATQMKMDPRLLVEARRVLDREIDIKTVPWHLRGAYLVLIGKLCREEIKPDAFLAQRDLILGNPMPTEGKSKERLSLSANLWAQLSTVTKLVVLGVLGALAAYFVGRLLALRLRAASQAAAQAPPREKPKAAAKPAAAKSASSKASASSGPQLIVPPAIVPVNQPAPTPPKARPAMASASSPGYPSSAQPAIQAPAQPVDHDEDLDIAHDEEAYSEERPPTIADLRAQAMGTPAPVVAMSPQAAPSTESSSELDDDFDTTHGGHPPVEEKPLAPAAAPASPAEPVAGPPAEQAIPLPPAADISPAKELPSKESKPIKTPPKPLPALASAPTQLPSKESGEEMGIDLDLDAFEQSKDITIAPIASIAPVGPTAHPIPTPPKAMAPVAAHKPEGAAPAGGMGTPPPTSKLQAIGKPLARETGSSPGLRETPSPQKSAVTRSSTPLPVISPGVLPAIIQAWDVEWIGPVGRSRYRLLLGNALELGRPSASRSESDSNLYLSLLPVGEDGKPSTELLSMLSRKAFLLGLEPECVRIEVHNKASAHASPDPLRPYWDWDNPMPGSERKVASGTSMWVSPHFGKKLAPISVRALPSQGKAPSTCAAELRFDVTFQDLVATCVLLMDKEFECTWGGGPQALIVPNVGEQPALLLLMRVQEEGLVIRPLVEAEWNRRQGKMLNEASLLLGGASSLTWKVPGGDIAVKFSPQALPRLAPRTSPPSGPADRTITPWKQ